MDTEENKNNLIKWFYLVLLVLSFTSTFMTRFIWAPLIPTVSPLLNISAVQAGAYMSAFYIGYVITQIPGGILADKFGVKYTLSVCLLVGGLSTMGMSTISGYSVGFALRILTGIGAGCVMSCCAKLIGEYFEDNQRSIAFGFLMISPTLGLMLSNQIGPALMNSSGWKSAFIVVGIINVIVAISIFLLIKPEQPKENSQSNSFSFLGGVKIFFKTRNLIGIGFAGFFYIFVAIGAATWANAYMTNLGLDTVSAGSTMMLYSVGGIIGSILSGIIVDKLNLNRKNFLLISYISIAIIAVLFGQQTELGMLKIIGFLFGFTSYLPNAHLNSLTVKYSDKNYTASIMGVQNFIFQLAGMVGPIILGGIIDITGQFNSVWYALGACPIIGLLFLMLIKDKQEVSTQ